MIQGYGRVKAGVTSPPMPAYLSGAIGGRCSNVAFRYLANSRANTSSIDLTLPAGIRDAAFDRCLKCS